jgi:hypothetical protein
MANVFFVVGVFVAPREEGKRRKASVRKAQ